MHQYQKVNRRSANVWRFITKWHHLACSQHNVLGSLPIRALQILPANGTGLNVPTSCFNNVGNIADMINGVPNYFVTAAATIKSLARLYRGAVDIEKAEIAQSLPGDKFNWITVNITLIIIVAQFILKQFGDIHPNPGPQHVMSNNVNGISICHANVNGIKDNFRHIRATLAGHFAIIALTETHLNHKHNIDLSMRGYFPIFRKDRQGGTDSWGGVGAYVASSLFVKRRLDLEVQHIVNMWLETRHSNFIFLLCASYRPPNSSVDFLGDLQYQIDLAKSGNINHAAFVGDLNADPSSNHGRHLASMVTNNNFTIHVTEPTHYAYQSATILDQIITNIPQLVLEVVGFNHGFPWCVKYMARGTPGFNHGLPWCVKYMARGTPGTTKPDGEICFKFAKMLPSMRKKTSFTQRWPGLKSMCWLFPYSAHPPRLTARTDYFQTTVSFLKAKNIYNVHSAIQHFYNTSLYICTLYYLAIWRRQDRCRKPAWGIEGTQS